MRQFPQNQPPKPPAAAPTTGTLSLRLGHKSSESSRQTGNQVETTTTYSTFHASVPVPARGSTRPHIMCPVCDKTLRVVVPSAERKRLWTILVIIAMVGVVLIAFGIFAAGEFEFENIKQGPPFAFLVLCVLVEIGLINLLIFVMDKDAWVLTGNHKPV